MLSPIFHKSVKLVLTASVADSTDRPNDLPNRNISSKYSLYRALMSSRDIGVIRFDEAKVMSRKINTKYFCLIIFLSYFGVMKTKQKQKSNTVRLLDAEVLKDAKIISIKKGYDTLQEYVTQAVKEKNNREK